LPTLLTPAWHFDFYRFQDPREWEDAGFRDIFTSPGLKLAEWAAHARAALPTPDLVVRLSTLDDDARDVHLLAHTPLGESLLAGLDGEVTADE
jgi:tRNA threonylcarbamoyladenosine biosynthesis protein TsaE